MQSNLIEREPTESYSNRFWSVYDGFCSNGINLVFHVLMLAIFEPIFYFTYATYFESSVYLDNISAYTSGIVREINSMSSDYINAIKQAIFGHTDKASITEVMDDLHISSLEAETSRSSYNQSLKLNAVIFCSVLILMCITLVVMAACRGVKIRWKRIAADNILLLVLLGAYEFVFFKFVVSKYRIQSSEELNYFITDYLVQNTDILSID